LNTCPDILEFHLQIKFLILGVKTGSLL